MVNHRGAELFPDVIGSYVLKELRLGSTMGPFTFPPFLSRIGISPLSTRQKRDSLDRRVIMDPSFPFGASVNHHISKTCYMGEAVKLSYPTIDSRITQLGPCCALYKKDLSRYFHQVPVCPLDYSLLGWRWCNLLFFDKCMPMGLHSAAYVCQRITNAIVHIHNQMGHFSINYLDDFGSAELWSNVWDSYWALERLLIQLGVQEAKEKAVKPTTC